MQGLPNRRRHEKQFSVVFVGVGLGRVAEHKAGEFWTGLIAKSLLGSRRVDERLVSFLKVSLHSQWWCMLSYWLSG